MKGLVAKLSIAAADVYFGLKPHQCSDADNDSNAKMEENEKKIKKLHTKRCQPQVLLFIVLHFCMSLNLYSQKFTFFLIKYNVITCLLCYLYLG